MNRDKQIEEMICTIYDTGESYDTTWIVDCESIAELLYKKGYRKASEVAREIFEEIENTLDQTIQVYNMMAVNTFDFIEQARARSTKNALQTICDYVTELKTKYESEGEDRYV